MTFRSAFQCVGYSQSFTHPSTDRERNMCACLELDRYTTQRALSVAEGIFLYVIKINSHMEITLFRGNNNDTCFMTLVIYIGKG